MNRSVLITGFILLQVLLGLNVPNVSGEKRWVDLTHSFDETTIYWPTNKGFQLDSVHHGLTEGGVLVRVWDFFSVLCLLAGSAGFGGSPPSLFDP